jgi:hypothetical protein
MLSEAVPFGAEPTILFAVHHGDHSHRGKPSKEREPGKRNPVWDQEVQFKGTLETLCASPLVVRIYHHAPSKSGTHDTGDGHHNTGLGQAVVDLTPLLGADLSFFAAELSALAPTEHELNRQYGKVIRKVAKRLPSHLRQPASSFFYR